MGQTANTASIDMTKKFSEKWWDKFLLKTNNLTKPTVIEDSLSLEETSLFEHMFYK